MPRMTRTTANSRPVPVVSKSVTSRPEHAPQKRAAGKTGGAPKVRAPQAAAVAVAVSESVSAAKRPHTKKAVIETLLRRPNGAVMTELMSATGWQEHSLRAALTCLRRDGQEILRSRDSSGATCYRIAAGA